jgi:ATP-dependent exoDNAse (exonuclease V) beta subunit
LSKISVSKIHSWAYQELERLAQKIRKKNPNSTFKVKLLEEARIKEILREIINKRGQRYLNMFQLYSFVMGNYNIDVPIKIKVIFEQIKYIYTQYKKDLGLYDFTDLPQYLLDKLKDYDEIIEGIDGLFIDEFQDVDPVQVELFERTTATKKFLVGDRAQSIYGFRSANPDLITNLEGYENHELIINYRSYQEIIDFATTYRNKALAGSTAPFTELEYTHPSHIECIRGYGGEKTVFTCGGLTDCIDVSNFGKEVNRTKVVLDFLNSKATVLCRTNREVKKIIEAGYPNAMTIHQAKGLEWKDVIVTSFTIDGEEDINVAYVAMTRAENRLLLIEFPLLLEEIERNKDVGKLKNSLLF